ncbi:MAG: FKBP-type peptidyl-prolyl cis-trans isomerase, partial [Muribaculaceae bacterium]|nr:FKBP-type peptidyl-prolyl cis-trans isomerase [Muribaculaceae bacterium]
VILAAAMTGCKDYADKSANRSDMTFEDSLACYGGEAMGAMFRAHIDNPNAGMTFDKSQLIRGIKEVMSTDTADLSYIIGLQMGMSAFQQYQALAQNAEINKADYVASIIAALKADSLTNQEQLRMTMTQLQGQLEQRQQAREEEEAYNSEEGIANRKAAQELFAGMKDNPAYHPGEKGVYYKVLTKGNGTKLTDGQEVMVEYTIANLEGNKVFGNEGHPRKITVGRAPIDMLNTVIANMEMGQTAMFYIPWEEAFGKKGMPRQGVGPCQTVTATVTVTPANAK